MDITGLVSALVVGVVVGALGRIVVPGRQPIGCLLTIAVGILAALLGTVLTRAAGLTTEGFNWPELGIQVLVAAVGVAVLSGARRGRD